MAVTLSYAAVSDVQSRNPYREIAASGSSPSVTDVERWLEEAESRLDGTLAAAGIPAPVTSNRGKAICRSAVTDYAEGHVRQAFAAAGGDGQNVDGEKQIERFEAFLSWIMANQAAAGAMMSGTADAPSGTAGIASSYSNASRAASITMEEKF